MELDLANDLSAKTMLFEHFIKAKVGSISLHAQYTNSLKAGVFFSYLYYS